MDAEFIDSIARAVDTGTRRRLLGAFPAAALALAPIDRLVEAKQVHRQGKKKKRKKKGPDCPNCPICPSPPPPPAPTCAQTCPSACAVCFTRPSASTMWCGGSISDINCTEPCSSDNDCGVASPFCVSPQFVDRATGMVITACQEVPNPVGFCTKISACP